MTLKLGGVRLTVDASRAELTSYWEIWHERAYDTVPGFSSDGLECVVDVGANVGAFALYQALKKKAKMVVAFEPSPNTFRRLAANVALNSVHTVRTMNAAVGESCGTLSFLEAPFSMNSRVTEIADDGAVSVPCVTLDSSLKSLGIGKVDLLKIDTEGYEMQVLKGASEALERTERIVMEIHRDAEKREFDLLLLPRGFRFVTREAGLLFYTR
ncbi:MAG: FkbM family methyltransferase [Terriglobia bacterium]